MSSKQFMILASELETIFDIVEEEKKDNEASPKLL